MVIFTTVSLAFLPQALALAESLRVFSPKALRVVCLLEPRQHLPPILVQAYHAVVFIEELCLASMAQLLFQRTVVEAATAVKARLFLYLLDRYDSEQVFIFLDPDIECFHNFDLIHESINEGVFVTPHLVGVETSPDISGPFIFRMLNAGVFNTGFVAVKRSGLADTFLHWWHNKLMSWCFFDITEGLFVDQKWLDFAVGICDMNVIRHRGYNLAHWNVRGRALSLVSGQYVCEDGPLCFVHYSGVKNRSSLEYLLLGLYGTDHFRNLAQEYLVKLDRSPLSGYSRSSWAYSSYHSGERISRAAQISMKKLPELRAMFPEPFISSNDELLFHADEIQVKELRG